VKRYRTICADPPWPGKWWPGGGRQAGASSGGLRIYGASEPSYGLMSLGAICELPVDAMAEQDAHRYLWIPDRLLVEGVGAIIAREWGFEPGRLIVWRKANAGMAGFPRPGHEALLVCKRGDLPFAVTAVSVQDWKQPYMGRAKIHSAKPDGAIDLIERASPGPYLEMFARRARFGWDYYGDESLGTAEMPGAAA
jgi:N6-adenosine-specific RNA methylase IME4